MAFVAGLVSMNAQTVLFEDDFESYDDFIIDGVGDWTLIDQDASNLYGFEGISFPNAFEPYAYIVFNSTATNPPMSSGGGTSDWSARSGTKAMTSFAAVNGPNNDWLISPAITLGAVDNELSFWYKACDATYGFEEFNVLISTTDTNPSSFSPIEEYMSVIEPLVWSEFTTNLDDYAGETVYIAIQCVSNDQFGFAIDDFLVTTGVLGVSDLDKAISSVYPNPVTDVLNVNLSADFDVNNTSVTLTDMSGRTVRTFKGATSYNVADLAAGLYVVKISDGKNTTTQKIVKK